MLMSALNAEIAVKNSYEAVLKSLMNERQIGMRLKHILN